MEELHPGPDKADALKQDTLARQRCLRSYELSGHSCQRGHCGYNGYADRAEERDADRDHEQQGAALKRELGKAVHHRVDFPDYRREELRAAHESEDASDKGCGACVDRVFHDDGCVGESQSSHRADNSTLVAYHSAHRCRAYERGDREKEYREYRSDAVDYL